MRVCTGRLLRPTALRRNITAAGIPATERGKLSAVGRMKTAGNRYRGGGFLRRDLA